jgi:hypothetical protein
VIESAERDEAFPPLQATGEMPVSFDRVEQAGMNIDRECRFDLFECPA